MRKFSSYGVINKKLHYFVPRTELLDQIKTYLIGEKHEEGGHYITIWAPRQTGKSSLSRDIYWDIMDNECYHVANIDIQNLLGLDDVTVCFNAIIDYINELTALKLPNIKSAIEFQDVFSARHLRKPLILMIDEFDSLAENVINSVVTVFRNIYINRSKDPAPAFDKKYLLHGVALIGVRSVLGVENKTGSPFNVQRSIHVRNLTRAEVHAMYQWYERESGQRVEPEVIDRIYYVTRGQPGLVSWFGELLTNKHNRHTSHTIDLQHFEYVYKKALLVEQNNTVMNIISKAKTPPYREMVLELFNADSEKQFRFEEPEINYLYMNGVIDFAEDEYGEYYIIFPGQFIQEKLFNYFSYMLVRHNKQLLADPFFDLTQVISEREIDICRLLELYQAYFNRNREELLAYAQRRVDLKVMEVVYHFQLYAWLDAIFKDYKDYKDYHIRVLPEFPTGNGKIDILIRHGRNLYGLELKSFSRLNLLNKNIRRASAYGQSLGLDTITLVVFLEQPVPDDLQKKYARPAEFPDSATVELFFIVTG